MANRELRTAREEFIRLNKKDEGIALGWSIIGPIGLFYTSYQYAIILSIIAIISAPTFVIPIVVWIYGISKSKELARVHNDKMYLEALSRDDTDKCLWLANLTTTEVTG